MLGDSAYEITGNGHLLAAGPVALACGPPRRQVSTTDDPKDIEYRVEARIDEHSEDVQLKQSTSTMFSTAGAPKRTNDAVKDCGLGSRPRPRPRDRHKCSSRVAGRLVIATTRSTNANVQSRKDRHHAMRTIL